MDNKTAITELIEKMNEAKDGFPLLGFDEEFIRGFNKAFQMACFIAEKVGKPKERQQIEEAFVAGDERGTNNIPFNAEQYYNQTYTQNNTKN